MSVPEVHIGGPVADVEVLSQATETQPFGWLVPQALECAEDTRCGRRTRLAPRPATSPTEPA